MGTQVPASGSMERAAGPAISSANADDADLNDVAAVRQW